jgi:hypothetical protein
MKSFYILRRKIMSKQSWENWKGYEADVVEVPQIAQQPRTPFAKVVNDPVQRRVVEIALLSGDTVDVDPRIVRAMGLEASQHIVNAPDVSDYSLSRVVPYSGTEGTRDIPKTVVVPDTPRANLPA